jgi:HSP20 family molecular chaperone IbpA
MNVRARRCAESLEVPVSNGRSASSRTPASRRARGSLIRAPVRWQGESPAIEIVENASEYKLTVPLLGIDPRQIYVFAMPQSLLIEIRFQRTIRHETGYAHITECIDRRISREFNLPVGIERDSATAQISGEFLHITARKTRYDHETSWSQLIHFEMVSSRERNGRDA